MPIKPEQLPSALNTNHHAVLVTGDEPLLMMETSDAIRQWSKDNGFLEREIYDVARGFDFSVINDSAGNLSLFAEQKIIEIRFEKVPDKVQQSAISDLLNHSSDELFWSISVPKMDKRQLGSAWVKQIESLGLVVQVWPISATQLPSWLRQRAQKLNLSIEPNAIQLLADRSEGNLLAAKQDIDKLSLLGQSGALTEEQVKDVVADSARYTVFELMDAAMIGNHSKVVKMLTHIKREGVVAVIVVATLYRESRQLLKMSQAIASGSSISEVLKANRVWSSRTAIVTKALQSLPVKGWQRIVLQCAHLDKLSKGAESGNVWDEILTCLLLMSGRALWKRVL